MFDGRTPLGAICWTRVSPGDYRLAMSRPWHLDSSGYVASSAFDRRTGKRTRTVYLHRLVTRCPAGMVADHRHHDPLDNRRESLRRATTSQNAANARRLNLVGKKLAPYRGVTVHKQTGKFMAQVKCLGVNHYCGLFDNAEDAAQAYDRKARALFGRFAILNNLPRTARAPKERAA